MFSVTRITAVMVTAMALSSIAQAEENCKAMTDTTKQAECYKRSINLNTYLLGVELKKIAASPKVTRTQKNMVEGIHANWLTYGLKPCEDNLECQDSAVLRHYMEIATMRSTMESVKPAVLTTQQKE